MKLFNKIKKWFDNQENLFYLFLFVLIVPNIALCFTEPLPLVAKVANVLLPLGCYYLIMTLSRNCGKMLWILFLFALSVRAVHHSGGYVPQSGYDQFFRSHGVAR